MIPRLLTFILNFLLIFGCKAVIPQQAQTNLPPCTKTDCDCRDFTTQAEAQTVLNAFPNDPYKLDRDGNGIACESLPKGTKTITQTSPQSTPQTQAIANSASVHLKLGNPSNANRNGLNNYLLEKPQYALSYNCTKGIPNWVSWQLNTSWLGSVERSEDFRPDPVVVMPCALMITGAVVMIEDT